jgi:hypothetical protein
MMTFEEALQVNQFGDLLEQRYGRWGHFSSEAANLCIQIAKFERVSETLMCFTMLNESTFNVRPLPNTNKEPLNVWKWDIGGWQLNMGWTYKSVWVGEFSSKGIKPDECFGQVFFDAQGNPAPFSGDPLSNGRMAARKLARIHGTDEEKAGIYTGGTRVETRKASFREWSPYFQEFFRLYVPGE